MKVSAGVVGKCDGDLRCPAFVALRVGQRHFHRRRFGRRLRHFNGDVLIIPVYAVIGIKTHRCGNKVF